MPRKSQPGAKPSAGAKYAVTRSDRNGDSQIRISEVCDAAKLWALIEDATLMGVSTTIAITRDMQTLSVTFFHDGVRYPWYIGSAEDWQEMVQAIEG